MQGPKCDAENLVTMLDRHIKVLMENEERKEAKIGEWQVMLKKHGIKNFERTNLQVVKDGTRDIKIIQATQAIMDLEDSIERNKAVLEAKIESRKALMRILKSEEQCDFYFIKGSDGKHLDRARYDALCAKRGKKSADDLADGALMGVPSAVAREEAEASSAGPAAKRSRPAGGAGAGDD